METEQNTTALSAQLNGLDASVQLAIARAEAEEKLFTLEQRRMKPYAESELVPKAYQGKIGNCMIANEMARRIGASTLSVMQNLYIVYGNPAWSAKFAISIFNTCGRFSAIKYRFDGEGDEYGCTAYATEKATGETVESPKITWKLVKAEGWLNKSGSKWKTMPDLMFRYRAAAYLVNTTAPELLNGLRTVEEYEDMKPAQGVVINTPQPGGIAAMLGVDEPDEDAPAMDEASNLKAEIQRQIEADRAEALKKAHAAEESAAEAFDLSGQ